MLIRCITQTFNLVLEAVNPSVNSPNKERFLNIFVTPETPNEKTPIVHFKLNVTNKLEGNTVDGPVEFEKVPKRRGRVTCA